MARLTIKNFDGEYPRTGATFLPENGAMEALNVRLYSGELRAWLGPQAVQGALATAGAVSIYRFENPTSQEVLWLSWDSDVDVQPTALNDVEDFRLYYTGDGTPKKTDWALASDDTAGGVYPGDWLEMGVPAPTVAPTLATTAGSAVGPETRFYLYTNVSTFGLLKEESAPSPPAEILVGTSDSVDISDFAALPTGNYNITHRRIYRTLPGEETLGVYAFVKEIAVADTTTNDDLLATDLGEALTTLTWTPPPEGLKGLTSMANGMMAGFVGNAVYFCEPYFHHAWPLEYMQSVPDQIVGLASYGNTLIVMTTGQPWGMIGTSPDSITVEKISLPEPCISKRSIAVDENGVLYCSPNGVVGIGPQFRGVLTNKLFRRQEWQLYSPDTMVGAMYDGRYFISYQSSTKGSRTMVMSRDDIPALSFLDAPARALFSELRDGELFYLNATDNTIYQVDADELNPLTYEWQSKRFVFDHAVTWSVLRLDIDPDDISNTDLYNAQLADIIADNEAFTGDTLGAYNEHAYNVFNVDGSLLTELPQPASAQFATVILLDEANEVRATFSITSYNPVRIPPFRSRDLKVRITGTLPVRGIVLATSFSELRGLL